MSDPESSQKGSPRHSPAPPLAPLEFLQSHRRGSITDPSLHAASTASPSKLSTTAFLSADPRPTSNYVFGDASTHELRKLLRSPSVDKSDNNKQHRSQGQSDSSRTDSSFNYNMRRHSIATSQDAPQGTKRKKSGDQNGQGEIDPQLVGPGVPNHLQVDPDAPAPKRRGSAIDARSLPHHGVNHERWWPNTRLPGTAALGAYSPADGRLPGGMAAFSWPANPQSPDAPSAQMHNPVDPSTGMPRPFDPTVSLAMMPPGFTADRRMSVPAVPSSVQTRVLRSRSRTPSRQKQNGASSASPGASASQEETTGKSAKDPSTPYSRSPELRISHKLAERKRRKEMKDLFDELRDQLPADRGMKASKWEILSKAIDFVTHLKTSHQDMMREIGMLRHELDALRQGISPFPGPPPPHAVVYAPSHVAGQFQSDVLPPQPQTQSHPPSSRPTSSQNTFSPDAGPSGSPLQNGSSDRVETPQS